MWNADKSDIQNLGLCSSPAHLLEQQTLTFIFYKVSPVNTFIKYFQYLSIQKDKTLTETITMYVTIKPAVMSGV